MARSSLDSVARALLASALSRRLLAAHREKPGDLSFWQPAECQFTIDLKAAKALGLAIPADMLAFADEVIE